MSIFIIKEERLQVSFSAASNFKTYLHAPTFVSSFAKEKEILESI